MALSMLLDLADPEFDHSVTVPLMPTLDIYDIIGFQPNSYLYTESQYLAVANVTHNFQEDATTTISLRGKPNLGFKRWLAMESRGAPNPANSPQDASGSLTKMQKLQPLQSILGNSQVNLGGRYMQLRNNAFTTWASGRLNEPTSWTASSPGWDNSTILATTTSLTGALAVSFLPGAGALESSLIPVTEGVSYGVEITFKRNASCVAADFLLMTLTYIQADGSSSAPGGANVQVDSSDPGTDEWITYRSSGFIAGSGAKYARLLSQRGGVTVGSEVIVDNLSIYPAEPAIRALLDQSLPTDTVIPGDWTNDVQPNLTGGIGTVHNAGLQYANTDPPPGSDPGSDISFPAGTGGPPLDTWQGAIYTVPSDGRYRVSCRAYIQFKNNSGALTWGAGTCGLLLEGRLGQLYDDRGLTKIASTNIVACSRTVTLLHGDILPSSVENVATPVSMDEIVDLIAGDELSVCLCPTGTAGTLGTQSRAAILEESGVTPANLSYLTITQLEDD